MSFIEILIGSLGLLLILERRAIISIIYFILLILLLSLYLITHFYSSPFLAYFLILIEIGAISIIFGLILMIIGERIQNFNLLFPLFFSLSILSSFFLVSNSFFSLVSPLPFSPFSSFDVDSQLLLAEISHSICHYPSILLSFLLILLLLFLPLFGFFFLLPL